MPQVHYATFHKSSYISAVKIYNSLPIEIKEIEDNTYIIIKNPK